MPTFDPTDLLLERAPFDAGGLWALLVVARDRLGRLILLECPDEDLSLFESSMDLMQVIGDLEWDYPDLPEDDFSLPLTDDLDVLGELIGVEKMLRRAVAIATELLRDTVGMSRNQVLTLARVVHLVGMVISRLTGRLP